MLNKLVDFVKNFFVVSKDKEIYNKMKHIQCEDCLGTGQDDLGYCYECRGKGFFDR